MHPSGENDSLFSPSQPGNARAVTALEHLVVAKLGCFLPRGWAPSDAMNRHENKVFESQHVILDDGVFVNCTFKTCSLEYSGGDVYVQNCQGEGCQLIWRGAAQRTVLLLQGLGLMVPPPVPPGAEPASRVQ